MVHLLLYKSLLRKRCATRCWLWQVRYKSFQFQYLCEDLAPRACWPRHWFVDASLCVPSSGLCPTHPDISPCCRPGRIWLWQAREGEHHIRPVNNFMFQWLGDFSSAWGGVSWVVTHGGWEQGTARVSVSSGKALPPSSCTFLMSFRE